MPIVVPSGLPAAATLKDEGIFVMDAARAQRQDIRPIRVALVNLMPTKVATETQLTRMLSNTPLQVEIDLLHMGSHESANTSAEHLERFYRTFDQVADRRYDGMVVTGAPVETLEFTQVDYWDELVAIMEHASQHVFSTLFLCWSAQAALSHFYGIGKRPLERKLFGVYEEEVLAEHPLTRGFDRFFDAPQSRWTGVDELALAAHPEIEVLAGAPETGFHLAATRDQRFVFVSGHGEYDEETLRLEYERDRARGLSIDVPHRYFVGGDPARGVRMTWRSHGSLLFSNWLNYCVYQETPYDLAALPEKVVAKFGGSSLADARSFAAAREIVRADAARRAVVVSAPGRREGSDTKVTDELVSVHALGAHRADLERSLVELSRQLASVQGELTRAADGVEARFLEICRELGSSPAVHEQVAATMREVRASDDRDFILSRGEYLSARIMAEYLGYDFVDAFDLIFFRADGELDEERTAAAVRHALATHETVVVPGFYGRGADGAVRVFDRGGSDVTGAILASATHADAYEKWTDVDGVRSADPRTVPDAERIELLSYDQLAEVARGGAQVYHPQAIGAVARAGVPIRIRSVAAPDSPGTTIEGGA